MPFGSSLEGKMNKDQVIELLECAKINCDNAKKVGMVMVEMVKMQIDEAIKLLEKDDEG